MPDIAALAEAKSGTLSLARPLRILQVVSAYYPAVRYGGPIRSVHGLSAALARRGHEVHVYTTTVDGRRDLDVPVDRPVERDGVSIHYFPVPALRRLWWSPALARRLRAEVGRFHVVHIHAVFLLPMRAAARAAWRRGVPYVVSPRGMLIRDVINRKSRWAKRAWINTVERTTLARASAVHVTAELEERELAAMNLPARNVTRIPNGVDLADQWIPKEAGPFADLSEPYVLFLSRISWKKGLDRLIAAWKWVPDVSLIIAGNDDEGYQPQLLALAREQGVADRVKFIGPVSDAHKWALYAHAIAFVLPSYSENFGNVVAEAMAMRCPVVVTPEVGIADLVGRAGAGIVTSGQPEKLADAVRSLLSNAEQREEFGIRGAQFVRAHLSWDAVAAQTERLYGRLRYERGSACVGVS